MKLVVSVLRTIYIALVSSMLATAVYNGAFRKLFVHEVSWAIHTAVSTALAFLGLLVVASLFLKRSWVPMLQILWWLPQLIKVQLFRIASDGSQGVLYSLYHNPMGIAVVPKLGWETLPQEYVFVGLNLVALAGLVIAFACRRTQRKGTAGAISQSVPGAAMRERPSAGNGDNA